MSDEAKIHRHELRRFEKYENPDAKLLLNSETSALRRYTKKYGKVEYEVRYNRGHGSDNREIK